MVQIKVTITNHDFGLDQWSSTFFVKSHPSRHFAWKSPAFL